MNVLGIDPGFSSVGFTVLDVNNDAIIESGLIVTKPTNRKGGVLKREDNFMRAQTIARLLVAVIDRHRVEVICAEAMSFPRSASVAAKMAMTWGILACLTVLRDIPVVQPSPQQIKQATCGPQPKRTKLPEVPKGASKEESKRVQKERSQLSAKARSDSKLAVQRALQKRYPALPSFLASIPPKLQEHPVDALGAIVASEDSDVFRLLRKLPGRAARAGREV